MLQKKVIMKTFYEVHQTSKHHLIMCLIQRILVTIGPGMELSFHDGTVRDVVFMQDMSNRTSLLISGGAGDCKIYASDCETGTPIRALTGHAGELVL